MKNIKSNTVVRIGLSGLLLTLTSRSTWNRMNYTEKGAVAGGALGAGTGAIVGSTVGAAGAGVAIGAPIGAVAGGLVGTGLDDLDTKQTALAEKQRRQSAQIKAQSAEINRLKRERAGS